MTDNAQGRPPLETPESDKVYYAIKDALDEGMDPREILDTVKDCIREWRLGRPACAKGKPGSTPESHGRL